MARSAENVVNFALILIKTAKIRIIMHISSLFFSMTLFNPIPKGGRGELLANIFTVGEGRGGFFGFYYINFSSDKNVPPTKIFVGQNFCNRAKIST